MRTPTSFEQRVYDLISRIPRGKVATYAAIGKALRCGSAQAIGQALRRNPFAPKVPCHRVIKSDLTLGGFSGETAGQEIKRKLRMLKSEGIEFTGGKLRDSTRLWRP